MVIQILEVEQKSEFPYLRRLLPDMRQGSLQAWRGLWLIAGMCALTTSMVDLAIRFIPAGFEHWHYALDRLYYLPIVAAGLTLGRMGGLLAAIISGISYLSLTPESVSPNAVDRLDRILETIVFCVVGLLTGVLSHRERRQRTKAEAAVTQLQTVYRELENNVEHVKRAARMSALGHLSAGLAHEIRNPLASIEGAASIVQNEPGDDSLRQEFLTIIQAECHRLNRLITNFLDFARPRAPELRPASIPDLLRSTILLVSQTANRSNISIREDFAPVLPPCQCDAEQIRQAILNLLLNAVQAMPAGGEIVVSARHHQSQMIIRVQDHGPGIPPENVDSIYDPFFTTKSAGTGLGLAVSYQIAKQHGGELTLEENSPLGAGFALTIDCHTENLH
jgi:two-component system, NtrC family, sensor histidine kinase HydH